MRMEDLISTEQPRFTKSELQIIILTLNVDGFAKFFSLSREEAIRRIRTIELKLPTEWVRELSLNNLMREICNFGSIAAFAKAHSVSSYFVKSCYRGLSDGSGMEQSCAGDAVLEGIQKDVLEKELKRVGSFRLLARLMYVKESALRCRAQKLGIEHLKLISPFDSGFESGKGRRAELIYKDLRGQNILLDMNESDPHAPYDFHDIEYGKVNVKSSRKYEYESKKRQMGGPYYWKFGVTGIKDCESIVLMCMDERHFNLDMMFLVREPKKTLPTIGSVTYRQVDLEKLPTIKEDSEKKCPIVRL